MSTMAEHEAERAAPAVHRGVQGRGGPAGAGRGQERRRGRPRPGSDRDGAARVGRAALAPIGRTGKTGLTTAEREELARLRKENPRSAEGAGDPKKGGGLLREGAAVRFRFIAAEKAHHSLSMLCRCLRVTRSGFYAWRRRPESARAQRDRQLKVLVRASFDASKQRYGSPRIHEDLLEQGERVSRKRVIRLMQEEGLKARRPEAVQVHDDERPRSAGRGESAGSAVHGRGAESAVGRRHDRVRDRRERQAVPGRDPRSVLAVRRRLGGQRGQ